MHISTGADALSAGFQNSSRTVRDDSGQERFKATAIDKSATPTMRPDNHHLAVRPSGVPEKADGCASRVAVGETVAAACGKKNSGTYEPGGISIRNSVSCPGS